MPMFVVQTHFKMQKTDISQQRIQIVIDLLLFVCITLLFHRLWWAFADVIKSIPAISGSAEFLAHQVYISSAWIDKHILLMNITTEDTTNTIRFHYVNGFISVNESCSGLKQMYQLAVLFLIFPGPWKHKLWFIPATFVVMFLVNILRILLLSGVLLYIPSIWDFFHLWVMRPFYYVVIFLLWVVWVEKIRDPDLIREREPVEF